MFIYILHFRSVLTPEASEADSNMYQKFAGIGRYSDLEKEITLGQAKEAKKPHFNCTMYNVNHSNTKGSFRDEERTRDS